MFALFSFLFVVFLMYLPTRQNVEMQQRRAEGGDAKAQFLLGYHSLYGDMDSRTFGMIPKDNAKARLWLGSAARSGYTKAYAPYAEALERDGQTSAAAAWREKAHVLGQSP
jgi:TPR repeat protein